MADPSIHGYISINEQGRFLFHEESKEPSAKRLALESIKKMEEGDHIPAPKIRGEAVVLSCQHAEHGHYVEVQMKTEEIARIIGKDVDDTKESIREGNLNQEFLSATLMRAPSIQITSPIEKREVAPSPTAPTAPTTSTTPSLISEKARERILNDLPSYGLTVEEYKEIESFYAENLAYLEKKAQNGPYFIRRDSYDPPLPRSLVFVADDPYQGLHVLSKAHGIPEIDVGGFSTLTLAFCMDTGKTEAYRSGKRANIHKSEIEANEDTIKYPRHCVAGRAVSYKGPFKARRTQKKMVRQLKPRETITDRKGNVTEQIPKVGFIMDYIPGGSLAKKIDTLPPLNASEEVPLERVTLARRASESLSVLHNEAGLVHSDLKPENFVLDKNGRPLLCDWGYATPVGKVNEHPGGTPGYIPPEQVLHTITKEPLPALPSADMWSFGVVLADLFHSKDWSNNVGYSVINNAEALLQMDKVDYYERNKSFFPNYADENHPDYIIYLCLQLEPEYRPPAKEVAEFLQKIEKQRKGS